MSESLDETEREATPARYRAYRFTDHARAALAARPAGQKIREFLADTVATRLGPLVFTLTSLGLRKVVNGRPARLPVTDEVLAELAAGSEITGIPAAHLLLAVLTADPDRFEPSSTSKPRREPEQSLAASVKLAVDEPRHYDDAVPEDEPDYPTQDDEDIPIADESQQAMPAAEADSTLDKPGRRGRKTADEQPVEAKRRGKKVKTPEDPVPSGRKSRKQKGEDRAKSPDSSSESDPNSEGDPIDSLAIPSTDSSDEAS